MWMFVAALFKIAEMWKQQLQERGPLPGPKTGLLSNTRKRIVRGDTADKARDFIGKDSRVESSRVREPRRIALLHGSQSRVLW